MLLSRSLQALTPQLDEIDAQVCGANARGAADCEQIGKCGSDLEQGTWPINLFLLYLNMKDLDEISQKLLSVVLEVLLFFFSLTRSLVISLAAGADSGDGVEARQIRYHDADVDERY